MKKYLRILIVCFIPLTGYSQQLPKVYNQFFMNPYLYNPAYVGVEGHTVVFLSYRDQWTNIDGAPKLANVSFHTPLKGGIGIGAMVYNDRVGPVNQTAGKVTASYLISVDRQHFFRFGMSLGAGTNTIDISNLDDPTDPTYLTMLNNQKFMVGDVGFTYHFNHFNLGVSLPSLFSYDMFTNESTNPVRVTPQDNVLFKINYRGHINDGIAIEPHFLYRYQKYLKNQYEGVLIVHLLHIVWIGGSYRQDDGIGALIGAKFQEKLAIGYSYGYGNTTYSSLTGPTHEIQLGYHIGSRKEHAEHVSSFIKSHRKTAEERAEQAELERQRKLQALQESREAEPTEEENEAEDELTLLEDPNKEKNTPWSYEQESSLVERVNRFGEVERGVKFDRINEEGEREVVFSWLPTLPAGASEEVYEIANASQPPIVRTKANGKKEAGITWTRTIDGGQKETLIIWDEILTAEEAEKIDHNPATTKSMENAVISIKAAPKAEPVTEELQTKEPEVSEVTKQQPEEVEEEETNIPLVQNEEIKELTKLGQTNSHVTVTRGNHLLELPAGNYVVAGVFESFEHAEDESDRLFQRGFHDAKVGFLTAKGYYFVVIFESASLSTTQTERNRIKKMAGMSEVWVLKVDE